MAFWRAGIAACSIEAWNGERRKAAGEELTPEFTVLG
jgi:hypothetical protein